MKLLALLPVCAGSKRVLNKNIREALSPSPKVTMASQKKRSPNKILQSINCFVQTSNGRLNCGAVPLLTKVATYQLSRNQNRTADLDTALR
jgi:hypothetical protein